METKMLNQKISGPDEYDAYVMYDDSGNILAIDTSAKRPSRAVSSSPKT